jgi:hypothetical protein
MTVSQITTQLRPTQQPRLPAAPVEYDRGYVDALTSILRQYFNQLDNYTQTSLTNNGGRFVRNVCGSFYDTTTQSTTANTATILTLNSTDTTGTNGVSIVSGSRITVTYPGLYNMQFSVQAQNTDNAQHDISIWIKQYVAATATLADLPGSTGLISIPARKSAGAGNEGHGIYGWNYFINMAASDYIQLYWSTDNAGVTIQYYGAGTSPTRPTTSSVVLTMSFVSAPLT